MAKSMLDSKNKRFLDFSRQPRAASQWGTVSKIGWESVATDKPMAGLWKEAAQAAPTNACAVAVMQVVSGEAAKLRLEVSIPHIVVWYSRIMYPVLFTLGNWPISSFGVFMAIAFLASLITVWRIARSYELNEEKTLDLAMLSFFGALIGSRAYFVLLNLTIFDDWSKIFLINRYPGLSFWGGLIGGLLTLWFFSQRLKISFWRIADYAVVAVLIGLILGDMGCFLGGCEYGVPSSFVLATPVVGLVGRRFPVALLEAVILIFLFNSLWRQVLRHHFEGKIAANFLIWVGIIKFFLEFYRGDSHQIISWISLGHLFSVMSVALGVVIIYTQSKRSWRKDLNFVIGLPTHASSRRDVTSKIKKWWYNQRVSWTLKLKSWMKVVEQGPKKLRRKLHVKPTPEHLRES